MMESVILLPVMLLVLMAAVQIAHLFFARYLTEYAAYCAARSGSLALSGSTARDNALRSAKQICSLISLSAPAGNTGALYALPWLGEVPGSQTLDSKLAVECPLTAPDGAFAAQVTMNFPLVVPVVNQFLSGLFKFRDEVSPANSQSSLQEGTLRSFARTFEDDIFPHVTITRRALVPANPPLTD